MPRTSLLPPVVDLVCVLALALGGKSAHEAGAAAGVVLIIAWPFALAALLAHAELAVLGRSGYPVWPGGTAVLAATYALGMALRVLTGRGTAPAFLLVAAVFLLVTMLGWRVLWRLMRAWVDRRMARRPARKVGS